MDYVTPFAPTPGDAAPGNLYADLGSRTLWLGVTAAVDPTKSVLISDIVGLGADIDQCLLDAKAYTNTQIATRAPTVHTHTASQITDFSAAVSAIVTATPALNWVTGMIMQWSGSLASIGVGGLAGWHLCDGSAGTPDLRDKFIIGAGNKAVGSVNPLASQTTSDDGAHTPVVGATTLTIAQMPAHNHTAITGTENANHTHAININTGTESAGHSHAFEMNTHDGAGTGFARGGSTPVELYQNTLGESNTHYHNVSGNSGIESAVHAHAIAAEGGGAGHAHVASAVAAHHHTLTSNQVRDVLPYYALAFIMKL